MLKIRNNISILTGRMRAMQEILLLLFTIAPFTNVAQLNYLRKAESFQQEYKNDLVSIIHDDTAYISFFPIDSSFKVIAKVQKLKKQPIFGMATSSGVIKEAQKILSLTFSINRREYRLHAYQLLFLRKQEQHKEEFFIPFFDLSCGNESYGGGRYLDFSLSDLKGNELEIDFNKAYNPYCAFVNGYACPIPPIENTLDVAIKAGEKSYGKAK